MRLGSTFAYRALLVGLLSLAGGASQAADAYITMAYNGEAHGQLVNTTRPATLCRQMMAQCKGADTVDIPITYTKVTVIGASDPEQHFFMKLPATKGGTVRDAATGVQYNVLVEFLSVMQRVISDKPRNPADTDQVHGGCTYRSRVQESATATRYFWDISTPSSPQYCYSYNNVGGTSGERVTSDTQDLGLAFRVTSIGGHNMKPGRYQGSATYSAGPGSDFDFGKGVTYGERFLTLHFDIEVRHPLKLEIDFPFGSNRLLLEPPGGWARYWTHGRVPEGLNRDLPFNLSARESFNAYVLCESSQGRQCGIRNEKGHQVPVKVALSLPGGMVELGNKPVVKYELPVGPVGAPSFFINSHAPLPVTGRGKLHFDVEKSNVEQMIKHAGTTYSGMVTVVFDVRT